jgi:excisionase family DNA binding protein
MDMSQWSHLPLVLTSDQAAGVLQINRRTLTNMLDRGTLRGVKIGKEWRVSRAEMMRFVEGNETKTLPVVTPAQSEAAATVINKGGLLVVRSEPLDNLSGVVKQARKQRVVELIHQAGL